MARQPAFARWLAHAMAARGYALDGRRAGGRQALAAASGVSAATISRYLSEDVEPSITNLRKIGTVLGCSLGDMLIGAGLATEKELSPVQRVVVDPYEEAIKASDLPRGDKSYFLRIHRRHSAALLREYGVTPPDVETGPL